MNASAPLSRSPIVLVTLCLACGLLVVACSKKPIAAPSQTGSQDTLSNVLAQAPSAYSSAALTVSSSANLAAPLTVLAPDSVYSSMAFPDSLFTPLPASVDGKIVSFSLPQGYMAVFAQDSDGTGPSACYIAATSALYARLPQYLQNSIHFVRCIPVTNPDKKGADQVRDTDVIALATPWFYRWSMTRASLPGQQVVPMAFGTWACTNANVQYLVHRQGVDHLLGFNEPDNTSQSNIPNIDTAMARYSIMLKTGLRMGAPATTQGHAYPVGSWEFNFMNEAVLKNRRVDFIPLHWYDWGNQTQDLGNDTLTAEKVFSRFQTYVQNVHATYPHQPLWITEFNANPNRTSAVLQEYFLKLATTWMNATSYIERYSFFFPAALPPTNADGSLSGIGSYYHDLPSTPAFAGNVVADGTIQLIH